MQELGKSNPEINVKPNGLDKLSSFSLKKKLSFIDRFQFRSSSLDILVKNLSEGHFKYLSQEFDSNVLDLVKQNGFYPYECMNDFKNFTEESLSKKQL